MLVQTCNASTWAPEAKGVFKATKTVLQRGTGGKVRKEKKMQKKKKSSGELFDVLCFVAEICCAAQAGLAFSIFLCQPPEC